LAEAVNEGEYLIPRLNRKQRALAIEGPVKVGGAEISPRLKQQLLNDIGDDPDQLPILQHALMRMWDYWLNNANREQALDLDHYNGIGRMTEALSRHGDEVYEELPDDNHRLLCMKLFKAITEKQGDGRGVRRPLPFSEIDEITGHQRKKMLTVIDAYRPIGRTFIMPGENVKIHDKIIIDISHESLMRVWQRLKNWVNDEADSARIYIRLCETAQLHNRGEAGFYRDPDLKIALAWRDNNKPNANWGTRINDSFELAMRFLDDSSEDFEAEQKAKEEARKRELEQAKALAKAERERAEIQRKSAKRNKVFAVFLFGLACLAGLLAYQANQAEKRAVASEGQAKTALSEAKMVEAELYINGNEPRVGASLLAKAYNENKNYSALIKRNITVVDTQPLPQFNGVLIEDNNSLILYDGRGVKFSDDNTKVGMLHKKKGNSGLNVYNLRDNKLIFSSDKYNACETFEFSPDGNLVTISVEKLNGVNAVSIYNVVTGKKVQELKVANKVTHTDVSNNSEIISAGTDNGEVYIWRSPEFEPNLINKTDSEIWEVRISPNSQYLAAIPYKDRANYKLLFFNLNDNSLVPSELYSSPDDRQRWWVECHFSKSGDYLVLLGGSDQEGCITVYDGKSGSMIWSDEATHTKTVFECDFSADETLLATASLDMTSRIWDIDTGEQYVKPLQHNAGLWHCRFSPDQTKLVASDYSAGIVVWDVKKGTVIQNTMRQESPVLGVSPTLDNNGVYAVLLNGKLISLGVKQRNRLPILLTHERQITNSLMLPDDHLATSGQDGKVKVWNLNNIGEFNVMPVQEDVWKLQYSIEAKELFGVMASSWLTAEGVVSWSWPDLKESKKYIFPKNSSRASVHPNGDLVAYTNKRNYEVKLYSFRQGKVIHTIRDHSDFIPAIEFSPDGKKMITTCMDEQARVYDIEKLDNPPLVITYGFSYGAGVVFSSDSKYFALRTTIGSDATIAKLFAIDDASKIAEFPHDSAVRDLLFSEDGSMIYTCSRSGELKVWDVTKGGELVLTAKQNEPIGSVLPNTNNGNLLITIDKETDCRVWDVKLGKVIDGPFKGMPGCDYWFIKLHTSKTLNGFVGYYGPTALAYWPEPLSFNSEIEIGNDIIDFSKMYIGGTMDVNSSFQSANIPSAELIDRAEKINPNNAILRQWKSWFLSNDKATINSPNIGLSRSDYLSFLRRQNTKQSLEEALIVDSSDTDVLELYGDHLLKRSKADGLSVGVKHTLNKRGNWYLNRAATLKK
jgi:WD40 repeat protein